MDLQRNSLGLGERPALLLVDMINGFTQTSLTVRSATCCR